MSEAVQPAEAPASVEPVPDDMRDEPRAGAPKFILHFFEAIKSEPAGEPLFTLFERLDEEAISMQRKHAGNVKLGIRAGTSALLLAIVQLSIREPSMPVSCVFFALELLAIGTSVICFFPEILGRSHHLWLLARYRAEQLRLAKWRLFIDPHLARVSGEALAVSIRSAVVENDVHEAAQLKERARREAPVSVPRSEPSDTGIRDVIDHYADNRLEAQIRYFHDKSMKDDRGFLTNPALMPGFFLLTLFFVVIHLAFEGYAIGEWIFHGIKNSPAERISFTFAVIAALIPAFLAGVRTWRSAFEITRNSTRAAAKEFALAAYRKRLRDPDISPSEAFGILACCEGLFTQEQGEWLRLMLEAESYM